MGSDSDSDSDSEDDAGITMAEQSEGIKWAFNKHLATSGLDTISTAVDFEKSTRHLVSRTNAQRCDRVNKNLIAGAIARDMQRGGSGNIQGGDMQLIPRLLNYQSYFLLTKIQPIQHYFKAIITSSAEAEQPILYYYRGSSLEDLALRPQLPRGPCCAHHNHTHASFVKEGQAESEEVLSLMSLVRLKAATQIPKTVPASKDADAGSDNDVEEQIQWEVRIEYLGHYREICMSEFIVLPQRGILKKPCTKTLLRN